MHDDFPSVSKNSVNTKNPFIEILINATKKILSSGLPWLLVSVFVIIIDRLSKLWALDHLAYLEPSQVTSFFNLTLAYNRGAAFSFLHQASGWQHFMLGGFAVIVSITVIVWLAKSSFRSQWFNIALSFILGGAVGNAIDRIAYGHVVDFFDFHLSNWHFAIFNVADSAITVGAFMLVCHWIFNKNKPII
jgi:signal peptidase II